MRFSSGQGALSCLPSVSAAVLHNLGSFQQCLFGYSSIEPTALSPPQGVRKMESQTGCRRGGRSYWNCKGGWGPRSQLTVVMLSLLPPHRRAESMARRASRYCSHLHCARVQTGEGTGGSCQLTALLTNKGKKGERDEVGVPHTSENYLQCWEQLCSVRDCFCSLHTHRICLEKYIFFFFKLRLT